MAEIISEVASRILNADGSYTATVSSGPRYYRDDNAAWQNVVHSSNASLPGNCEFVPITNGYRIWRPNGLPPYNPTWLSTDYWLQVEDLNAVTTFSPRRSTASELVALASAGSTRPAWKWTWNTNLTHRLNGATHEWVSADGVVQFSKRPPVAWSNSDPRTIVTGSTSVAADGTVTLTIDLSSLSYPITLDPTTVFNSASGDGTVYSQGDVSWSAAVNAAGTAAINGEVTVADFAIAQVSANVLARQYLPFDTSSLGAASKITSGFVRIYKDGVAEVNTGGAGFYRCVSSSIVSTTTLVTSDYPLAKWGSTIFGSIAAGSWVLNSYNNFTLNADGLSNINKTGFSKFGIRSSNDIDNVGPAGTKNSVSVQLSEGANPPILSVTYTYLWNPGAFQLLTGIS